ncbi:hypothetical protein BJX99DRAFT_221004 [Aspergillus californicus]
MALTEPNHDLLPYPGPLAEVLRKTKTRTIFVSIIFIILCHFLCTLLAKPHDRGSGDADPDVSVGPCFLHNFNLVLALFPC